MCVKQDKEPLNKLESASEMTIRISASASALLLYKSG